MTPFVAPGWRVDYAAVPPALARVVADAVACIGMRETEPNRGIEVDQWLRLAGADPGEPWCASFLTACYQRIAPRPMPRIPSVRRLFAWAGDGGHLLPAGAPLLPGDIAGRLHPDGHGHCGIVVAGDPVCLIEGNADGGVRGTVTGRGDWQWFARVAL